MARPRRKRISFTQALSSGAINGVFSYDGVGGAPSFLDTFSGTVVPVPNQPPFLVTSQLDDVGTGGTGSSTIFVNLASPSCVESGVFSITPIPVPATWPLFGAGMPAAGAWVRRRQRRG